MAFSSPRPICQPGSRRLNTTYQTIRVILTKVRCPAKRELVGVVLPFLNARSVSVHLDLISRKVAQRAHAILVLDGAGFHIAKDLHIPANMALIKLPPYSPELNPIENAWAYLRGNKLSNTVYETYDEIVSTCCEAWNSSANDPERVATSTSRSWATVNA